MEYASRATRALVLLHDQRMRAFLPVWRQAAAKPVTLPATDSRNYQSLDALLRHLFSASLGYLRWVTETLQLPMPALEDVPPVDQVAAKADQFLDQLLTEWSTCLTQVDSSQLRSGRFPWFKVEIYIETLLEHAVVHPLRHQFQLEELLS